MGIFIYMKQIVKCIMNDKNRYNELLEQKKTKVDAEMPLAGKYLKCGIVQYDFKDYQELCMHFNQFCKEISLSDFVFRGLSKESYSLKPCVKRGDDANDSFEKEVLLLKEFAESLSQNGIHMPAGGCDFLRFNAFLSNLTEWPPSGALDFLAYAQHHGLSTRMLDWTFDINVALYMAVRSKLDEQKRPTVKQNEINGDCDKHPDNKTDENMVIWAFNYRQWNELINNISQSQKTQSPYDSILRFTFINYEDNCFARQQKGLLSYTRLRGKIRPIDFKDIMGQWNRLSNEPTDNMAVDEIVREDLLSLLAMYSERIQPNLQMIKITIPGCKAAEIEEQLAAIGYTEERLFPTPENSAKMVMKKIWGSV